MARISESTTSPRAIQARKLEGEAIELRMAGGSYRDIGDQLGVSGSSAHRAVARVLKRIAKKAEETAEQVKVLELMRLDAMWVPSYAKAVNGDEDAIATCLRIMERRARLLGLDSVKVDLEVTQPKELLVRWVNDWRNLPAAPTPGA